MFDLIFANTIGASHIRHNIPCQDYGLVKETENYKVFAVSDGHGDSNCFRSDRGSRFICETVIEILPEFIDSVLKNNNECLLYDLDKSMLKQLSTSVIGNWLCRIEEDIADEPITSEIIAEFESYTGKHIAVKNAEEYKCNIRVERAYGCTLIAGILTDDFLFLMHHGDGRCIVINECGDIIQPIPWDNRCVGSITTSCCDRDAIDNIRYSIIDLKKHNISACFLSSDGVEDSFASTDAMYSYFLDNIIYAVNNSAEKLSKHLSETLPELSELGSSDDITIAGFIDVASCIPFIEKFKAFSKKVELEVSLEKTEDKIKSILNGGLYTHLKKNYQNIQQEYDKVKIEYDRLCASRDALEHNLSSQTTQLNQVQKNGNFEITNLLSFFQNLYKGCRDSFLEDSIERCIEELTSVLHKIDELKEKKDLLEVQLSESKKDFEKINDEYKGYLESKINIEKQIAELKN